MASQNSCIWPSSLGTATKLRSMKTDAKKKKTEHQAILTELQSTPFIADTGRDVFSGQEAKSRRELFLAGNLERARC